MFQTAISNNIAFGVVGELFLDGPLRAQPGRLTGATPANNVVGRAFTIADDATASFDTSDDPQPLDVVAGGSGVFAGILANPKVYVAAGTAADGTLAPTLTLPNNTMVELVQECAGLIVTLPEAFAIGDLVWYNTTTGVLARTAPGTATLAGHLRVPNGVVTRYESAAAGLAVITFDAR